MSTERAPSGPTPVSDFRWPLADGDDAQQALFDTSAALLPELGSGRMSGLEFLHVTAKKIINPVPASSRMPFRWTINAYRGCSHGCTYCFARPTHEYLGLNAGSDFDRRIVVKINAVDRLRAELRAPTWQRASIAMGTNTDPYQRCEAKYRITRGIVEVLTEHANPFSILTKSPLVLRDLDILTRAAACTTVHVSFSIGTLDERVWRATEPGSPHPRRRVEAIQELTAAGIDVGVLIAPVLPGLSDSKDQLAETVAAVTHAGARSVTALALHLRPVVREHFLQWLADFDPQLHQRYLRRYGSNINAPAEYGRWLRDTIAELRTAARRSGPERAGRQEPPG